MTWQESLRQLDARLAKGEIGAAEYRKSRDEILAEASSGSPAPGRGSRDDLWAAAEAKAAHDEDAAAAAETTLIVTMGTPRETEQARGQASGREPEADTSMVTVEDETTQVVDAERIPPAHPAAPFPAAPPVQGGPPPGTRPTPFRAAPIQGQEVFSQAGSSRGAALARFLVPLLVLALVGGGVWWFVLRDGNGAGDGGGQNPPAQPPPSTSVSQAPGTDAIVGKLPELPGRANENNGTMTLDQARDLKLFTPTYATMLADNGASEIVYRGALGDGFAYLLVASPIPPANGADGVAVLSSEHLQQAGFTPAAEVSPDDPQVITRLDPAFRTFIAVYSSGDVWVQLNVSSQPNADEKALRTEFQKVLGTLTKGLPAD